MKKYFSLLIGLLLLSSCANEKTIYSEVIDGLEQSSAQQAATPSAENIYSSVAAQGHTSSVDENPFCDVVDAGLPFESWHEFQDKKLGFSIRYPGYVSEQQQDEIYLQNYKCKYDIAVLERDQYYLHAMKLPSNSRKDCESLYKYTPEEISIAPGVTAFRGVGQSKGQGEGDAIGNHFFLCIDQPVGLLFVGAEDSDEGELVNSILDTVEILPRSSEAE